MISEIKCLAELRKFEEKQETKIKEQRNFLIKEKRKIRDLVVNNFDIEKSLFESPYKKEADSILIGIFSKFDRHIHIRKIQINIDEFHDDSNYIKLELSRPWIEEDEDEDEDELLCEHWDDGTIEIQWDDEGFICFAERCFDWAQNENFSVGKKLDKGEKR